MNNTFYNSMGDEESSLLEQRPHYAAFSLEVDQVEQQYVNTQATSKSMGKSALLASKIALALLVFLVVMTTYPLAADYLMGAMGNAALKEKNTKPNFVFVLIDDAGWNSIGANSDVEFATPFINGLVSKGITLDNYYSQQMCTPARAALMTGRYPVSIGMQYGAIESKSTWGVPIEEVLLPEALRDYAGYKNYGLGKWNLGHYNPQFLPTARGFDYFLGFVNSGSFYWSKKDPSDADWFDFMLLDKDCYNLYVGKDFEDYSTYLYTDKAITAVEKHDFDTEPMFLYMSYQAAHDPWHDHNAYETGIPQDYLGDSLFNHVQANVVGAERQQYAMSLLLLDKSVNDIYDAFAAKGVADNTYFIIASDNGGCYAKGGKNGPLRGSKSSLHEGGTKVFAYLYSDGLSKSLQGTTYKGLFHVTDWFPTMLGLAGVDYKASSGRPLDGVDQSAYLLGGKTKKYPRTSMLYNMILNVEGHDFDIETNAPLAIRDEQYKLIHAFFGNDEARTYYPSDLVEDDDNFYAGSACTESRSLAGAYTKYLFDLTNDPYETVNLYHNSEYTEVRTRMYRLLNEITVKTEVETDDCDEGYTDDNWELSQCEPLWRSQNKMIQPWDFTKLEGGYSKSAPSYCENKNNVFSYNWKSRRE